MKKKLSITINEEKIKELEKFIENGRFRNKSHLIEYSVSKFLKGEEKCLLEIVVRNKIMNFVINVSNQ